MDFPSNKLFSDDPTSDDSATAPVCKVGDCLEPGHLPGHESYGDHHHHHHEYHHLHHHHEYHHHHPHHEYHHNGTLSSGVPSWQVCPTDLLFVSQTR